MTTDESTKARTLINAVERMLEQPEKIDGLVRRYRDETGGELARVAQRIISHYSNQSALAGGIGGLTGLIPGVGTVIAIAGTTLAEMAYVLKLEVEMCLGLACAYGHDIRDPRERQLALLLAAVHTREVATGRDALIDLGDIALTAAVNYTPREIEKLTLKILGFSGVIYALRSLPRAAAHALPIIGIGINAGFNKVLTARVGKRATAWYALRERGASLPLHDRTG